MKWKVHFKQALAMFRDVCGTAAAFICTLKNSQMHRVWREAVRVRRPSWTELRQRTGITFCVSTLGFVLFTAIIWIYDPIDGVWSKTLLNLIYTVVPLSTFLENKDTIAQSPIRLLAPCDYPGQSSPLVDSYQR